MPQQFATLSCCLVFAGLLVDEVLKARIGGTNG